MPYRRPPDRKISIWKVIKDSIGKDLTKLTMPVDFNEPTSMLQKMAENMEYHDLLVKANRMPEETMRMLLVVAFNIA